MSTPAERHDKGPGLPYDRPPTPRRTQSGGEDPGPSQVRKSPVGDPSSALGSVGRNTAHDVVWGPSDLGRQSGYSYLVGVWTDKDVVLRLRALPVPNGV